MSILQKISQQTFWQILGKVVTSISTFIILGLVTRNYGKEGTGVFTLTLTYLAIFYMLADFGFNAHILKQVQSSKFKIQNEWKKLLGTRIMWAVLLIVLAVGLLPFLPFAGVTFSQSVWFGVLAVLGSSVYVTCNLIFQSKLRYDLSVLASSIGTLISLLFFWFLITLHYPISYLLIAHFVGWVTISLTALLLVSRFFQSVFPIYNIRYTIYLFRDSWPIAATLALNVIYFRADAFLIAYFKNNADVGLYNVAYSVFQSALVLPAFIMNSYYPLMLKSLEKIKQVALGLLGLSMAGTLLTLILAPFIIGVLTGGGFDGSTQSLKILSLGFPAYFLSALLMWVLITKGKYKSMFTIYTSGFVLNIALNFLFIPQYSFVAASWITVVSEYFILSLQVMVLLLRKK
ncbi:oligosaccharide flippase family protein [Candidatus Daviesbacteria bacterium]|nr:oligosaccharide flippase family protein [Candidatus Daviesbacteria bacterium]